MYMLNKLYVLHISAKCFIKFGQTLYRGLRFQCDHLILFYTNPIVLVFVVAYSTYS